MINAIIVDDEVNSRKALRKMVERHCPLVTIKTECDNINDAEILLKKEEINLVFLDVEMPHGSGFDLLKRFDEPTFRVIFVTGFGHYAIQAFRFCALDYLLKPVNREQLQASVKRAAEQMELHQLKLGYLKENIQAKSINEQKILIPYKMDEIFVPIAEIMHLKADGAYTYVYLTNNRDFHISKKIGYFQNLLPQEIAVGIPCFYRIHHSIIVNLFHIRSYQSRTLKILMKDKHMLNVAQRKKTRFGEMWQKYNLG